MELDHLILNPEFERLCTELISSIGGIETEMTIEYLKDVSAMLALISSVRENQIERHLQAERALLPQMFAFGHINYVRYGFENGFVGCLTGRSFSTVHGDLNNCEQRGQDQASVCH